MHRDGQDAILAQAKFDPERGKWSADWRTPMRETRWLRMYRCEVSFGPYGREKKRVHLLAGMGGKARRPTRDQERKRSPRDRPSSRRGRGGRKG